MIEFTKECRWSDLPASTQATQVLCLKDQCAVAVAGGQTELSAILRKTVAETWLAQKDLAEKLCFDGTKVAPAGAALALGMTVDAIDAHDGHRLCKGHAGAALFGAWAPFVEKYGTEREEALTALAVALAAIPSATSRICSRRRRRQDASALRTRCTCNGR